MQKRKLRTTRQPRCREFPKRQVGSAPNGELLCWFLLFNSAHGLFIHSSSSYIRLTKMWPFSSAPSGDQKVWKNRSLRQIPRRVAAALVGAFVSISMALLVLHRANDSLVDNWVVTPSVFLSIIAATTNAMLRFAFEESSGLFWWSNLLSGAPLQDLHAVWELGHSALALLDFRGGSRVYLNLRIAATLVLLLAINGPFLQRAVTVTLETRPQPLRNGVLLPIRHEPMWNLTTKIVRDSGHVWSTPPYQDEFAEVTQEFNRRQPMRLSQPVCHEDATCRTEVEVAGFSWSCSTTEVKLRGARTIGRMYSIVLPAAGELKCSTTGSSDSDLIDDEKPGKSTEYCEHMQTEMQLDLFPINGDTAATERDLPWLAGDLPPHRFNYTSYRRSDENNETLTRQECIFSSAFVRLPIEISNQTVVTLLPIENHKDATRNQSLDVTRVESIPSCLLPKANAYFDLIGEGFREAMANLFSGGIFYDSHYANHFFWGTTSRQFINQDTIKPRGLAIELRPLGLSDPDQGYRFSIVDPLDEFVRTLNELSLRYALKEIPSSSTRVNENEAYIDYIATRGGREEVVDVRERARALMPGFSKTVRVDMSEDRIVAVYKGHFAYTVVAMGMTFGTAFVVLSLLSSVWPSHGRVFSMSPLEIAKAFDAPLLSSFGSNATGKELARDAPAHVRVRYGEAISKVDGRRSLTPSSSPEHRHFFADTRYRGHRMPGQEKVGAGEVQYMMKGSPSPATSPQWPGAEGLGISEHEMMLSDADEVTRLLIDVSERVSTPVRGRMYA